MATTDELPEVDPRDAPRPRGRTSFLTILLIVFNIVGVGGYAALMYMDATRQEKWSRAVFLRQLAIWGLPIDERETLGKNDTDPEQAAQGSYELDPLLIKEAYSKRGLTPKGKFLAVREPLKHYIRYPIDPDILNQYFSGLPGRPVGSLKTELGSVKNTLPGEIDKVAEEVGKSMADKKDDAKQQKIRDLLYPMAAEGWQVGKCEALLRATPAKDLDGMVVDAAKRKILYDILKPMEIFRPSEPDAETFVDPKAPLADRRLKKPLLDRMLDLKDTPTSLLVELLLKRCDDVISDRDWIDPQRIRDNFEKRRAVAFLLLTISQVEIPGGPPPEAPAKKEDSEPKKDDKGKEEDKAKDEGKGMVKFVTQDGDKKNGDNKDMKKDGDDAKKGDGGEDKGGEPQPKGGPSVAPEAPKRPERNFAFKDMEKRVEAVVGLVFFDQACLDLTLVTEILEKQAIEAVKRDRGDYIFIAGSRINDPKHFVEQLVKVMRAIEVGKQLDNKFGDDGKPVKPGSLVRKYGIQFVKEAEFTDDLEKQLTKVQGQVHNSDELLAIIYESMKDRVVIVEDPLDLKLEPPQRVRQKMFEAAVDSLLFANAIGYTGEYMAAIKRIQAIAGMIEVRQRELREQEATYGVRKAHLDVRVAHEKDVAKRLEKERTRTFQLARQLKELQQELFRAQVELVGAHEYNAYLEQFLRGVEREMTQPKGKKGGKGQ